MRYISTRGDCAPFDFKAAVMAGLAPDGGLFLPESIPSVKDALPAWKNLPFAELFQEVSRPFIGDSVEKAALADLATRSYSVFNHPQVTPVLQAGKVHICELFHGPTFAFKDVALQFLGNLFEYFLAQGNQRLTVLGATSGDTGSAAIHALKGRRNISVFILFPQGRVSPMQERQMTTVPDANVHAMAVRGSFDDAQAIVKTLFNDRDFNNHVGLGAINSINWARVMAQISYFFFSYFRVMEAQGGKIGDPIRYSVPTGNFGHIFAGTMARRMGLPIEKLILATNKNAILHQFVQKGAYRKATVHQTLSPSMDIQVASNFERYLYLLSGNNPDQVKAWMAQLASDGGFQVSSDLMDVVRDDFDSVMVDDEATVETIRQVEEDTGYLLDPHSAIAYRAAQALGGDSCPVVSMATAHPAKFSGAIEQAISGPLALPLALETLQNLPTRVEVMDATPQAVKDFIQAQLD